MQQHFTTHKQKYLTFFVVAVLIIIVGYAGRNTEALGRPMEDQAMMMQMTKRCPPKIVHMMDMVRFFHPCLKEFLRIEPAPAQPAPEVPAPTENTATSTQATSTPETATSTNATSTPEVSDEANADTTTSNEASVSAGIDSEISSTESQ